MNAAWICCLTGALIVSVGLVIGLSAIRIENNRGRVTPLLKARARGHSSTLWNGKSAVAVKQGIVLNAMISALFNSNDTILMRALPRELRNGDTICRLETCLQLFRSRSICKLGGPYFQWAGKLTNESGKEKCHNNYAE